MGGGTIHEILAWKGKDGPIVFPPYPLSRPGSRPKQEDCKVAFFLGTQAS